MRPEEVTESAADHADEAPPGKPYSGIKDRPRRYSGGDCVPSLSEEEIRNARRIDLLSYLRANEPSELVRVSGETYCTREHDSLKISNGKWYWFSRGIGGSSALDYLIKVRGLSLPKAVEAVTCGTVFRPSFHHKPEEPSRRSLILPERNDSAENVIRYLRGRGIHPEIIRYCLERLMLYESIEHHNAVFVGYDELGWPRCASLRGTSDGYKGEAAGSDKRYSFGFTEDRNAGHLHLFESAVDLMSYATLLRMKGIDWRRDAMLSLSGVFRTNRQNGLPAALARFLAREPGVGTVHLHLDNDDAGRGAAEGIRESLTGRYTVLDEPPVCGKDVNDQLMIRLGIKKEKEVPAR